MDVAIFHVLTQPLLPNKCTCMCNNFSHNFNSFQVKGLFEPSKCSGNIDKHNCDVNSKVVCGFDWRNWGNCEKKIKIGLFFLQNFYFYLFLCRNNPEICKMELPSCYHVQSWMCRTNFMKFYGKLHFWQIFIWWHSLMKKRSVLQVDTSLHGIDLSVGSIFVWSQHWKMRSRSNVIISRPTRTYPPVYNTKTSNRARSRGWWLWPLPFCSWSLRLDLGLSNWRSLDDSSLSAKTSRSICNVWFLSLALLSEWSKGDNTVIALWT